MSPREGAGEVEHQGSAVEAARPAESTQNAGETSSPSVAYDYAYIQVVPRVHLGDRLDVGVVLQSRGADYLGLALVYDPVRLAAAFPSLDLEMLRLALDAVERVATGGLEGGPMGLLPAPERFHWLTAPRSAVVQTSAVHEGWACDPEAKLMALANGLASD